MPPATSAISLSHFRKASGRKFGNTFLRQERTRKQNEHSCCLPVFYPEQFRVNDICFELAAQGHNITVLTGLPNYPSGTVAKEYRWFRKRKEEINGVQVIRSWLTGRGKGSIRLALNYLSFALSASIQALSLRKDFDLVLIYQLSPVAMALPGILLKKLTGKPLVLYCHDLWPESIASAGFSSESTLYKLLYRLSRWIYLKADHIFISSRQFEEYFTETLKISGPFIHLPVYAEVFRENTSSFRKRRHRPPLCR